MAIKYVIDDADLQKLINKDEETIVIVEFFAHWSKPCKDIAPVFERLAQQTPSLEFVKCDVEKCPLTTATINHMDRVPAFFAMRRGAKLGWTSDAVEDRLVDFIKDFKNYVNFSYVPHRRRVY